MEKKFRPMKALEEMRNILRQNRTIPNPDTTVLTYVERTLGYTGISKKYNGLLKAYDEIGNLTKEDCYKIADSMAMGLSCDIDEQEKYFEKFREVLDSDFDEA